MMYVVKTLEFFDGTSLLNNLNISRIQQNAKHSKQLFHFHFQLQDSSKNSY